MFSAPLPPEITRMAATLLRQPVRVEIKAVPQAKPKVKETTVETTNDGKNQLVLEELESRQGRVLIFARTQSGTEPLARLLDNHKNHSVVALHGGRSHGQRKQALERLRSGTHRIMVATDLAGRGIDVDDIEHVINFLTLQPERGETTCTGLAAPADLGRKGMPLISWCAGKTRLPAVTLNAGRFAKGGAAVLVRQAKVCGDDSRASPINVLAEDALNTALFARYTSAHGNFMETSR